MLPTGVPFMSSLPVPILTAHPFSKYPDLGITLDVGQGVVAGQMGGAGPVVDWVPPRSQVG